LEPQSYTFHT